MPRVVQLWSLQTGAVTCPLPPWSAGIGTVGSGQIAHRPGPRAARLSRQRSAVTVERGLRCLGRRKIKEANGGRWRCVDATEEWRRAPLPVVDSGLGGRGWACRRGPNILGGSIDSMQIVDVCVSRDRSGAGGGLGGWMGVVWFT